MSLSEKKLRTCHGRSQSRAMGTAPIQAPISVPAIGKASILSRAFSAFHEHKSRVSLARAAMPWSCIDGMPSV